MTFVDADALVRYLTRDDPAKAERVRLRVAKEHLVVTLGTLAEVGYVLQSWFKYPRPTIVQALQAVISEPNLPFTESMNSELLLHWRSVSRRIG